MDVIDRIRAFNRFYSRRLGLLGRSYLSSGLTMTDVRVLYELCHHPGQTAREVASGLGIDEGYMSRMLKRFRAAGWLAVEVHPLDSRAKTLALSEAGRKACVPLEERSRAEVGRMIGGMSSEAQTALAEAVERVTSLLDPGEPVLRDLRPGDVGWVVGQHGALYARDDGYDASFEALVAEILADFLKTRNPARERGWIAEAGGRRLGSIFCVRADDQTARLRLFLLVPEARGLGLGQRMHDACLGFARNAGYRRMVLWTHKSHEAACALYARNGWRKTGETPARAFGQDVIDQEWEIDL